jgi:hypothetical protein
MARGLLSRNAMRGWLILALIGLPGCFDAHGRVAPEAAIDAGASRDASARPDAARPLSDAGGPIVAPGACTSITPDAAHAPIAVGIGERIPVHVRRLAGEGCGCTPEGRRWIGREGPLVAGLEVCGCSDEDPCVDPGYEATVIAVESAAAGVTRVTAAASELEVAVVDPAECGPPLRVRGVTIEVPSGIQIPASGLGVWARIELEAAYCCVGPRSYVRTLEEKRAVLSRFWVNVRLASAVKN